VPFGDTVIFDLTVNDFAPPHSFINILSGPEKGTVEILDSGLLTYRSNANLVGTERMTYELCSEACECSISTVDFIVGEDARCDVPTIFTPNNDGVNDFFVVPCLLNTDEFPHSQVILFNRWGDEVYKSPVPYKNDWRGTFNGEDVPAGTYFYIIDLGDGRPPINGYTVIQR
jgi:gliding motility-associated-like protein